MEDDISRADDPGSSSEEKFLTEFFALRARVERMQLSLRAARIYFWEWDIANDFIRWTNNLEGELLRPSAPATVAEFKQLVHPDDLAMVSDRIDAALRGDGDYFAEFRMVRGDGSVRWTSSRAAVIRDAYGVAVHLVGVDRDITEKRELIDRLQANEAHLRTRYCSLAAAEQACQSGAWDWQLDRNEVYVSESYRSLYGFGDKDEVSYETWLEKVVPEDRPAVVEKTQQHFDTGSRYDFEFRIAHPTRGVRWIAALGSVSRNDNGQPVRFTGINIDVTDRVTASEHRERQLEEQQKRIAEEQRSLLKLADQLQAQQASLAEAQARIAHGERLKLVGQFVGNIVHDVNNLLAGVAGAGILLRRGLPSGPHIAIVDQLDRTVSQGSKLVRQLLDLSRQGSQTAERIDVREHVLADLDLYRNVAGPGIELSVETDDGLWPVFAASSNLQTVILNLVANARDAQPSGGVIRIEIRNCRANQRPVRLAAADYVTLTVSDDGPGMSPEVLKRAGEPFFTTKPRGSGTGLGLATVREFARAHGGDMTIRSGAGEGTSVRLYLQRAPIGEEIPASPEALRDASAHGDASLLLVEDDAAVRRHLAAKLQVLNYRVTQADNVAVARALFEHADGFDLALLGLHIGGEAGSQLAEQLRERKPTLPVIFIMGAIETKAPTSELVFRRPVSEALLAQAVLEKLGRAPPSIVNVETLRLSERVRGKIHDAQMRSVFDIWKEAASRTARVPLTALVAQMRALVNPYACLIRIKPGEPQEFKVVFAGSALEERLGRSLAGEILHVSEQDSSVSMARAYQRCVRGVAYFDYARFGMSNASRLLFERLCLPLSTDGVEVDHIFSVARFEEADADF